MAINYRFALFSSVFTQKEWGMAFGIMVSSRGCAVDNFGQAETCSDNKCESQSAFGITVKACRYCCDDKDLCNGAGLTVVGTAVILSTTVISALMTIIL